MSRTSAAFTAWSAESSSAMRSASISGRKARAGARSPKATPAIVACTPDSTVASQIPAQHDDDEEEACYRGGEPLAFATPTDAPTHRSPNSLWPSPSCSPPNSSTGETAVHPTRHQSAEPLFAQIRLCAQIRLDSPARRLPSVAAAGSESSPGSLEPRVRHRTDCALSASQGRLSVCRDDAGRRVPFNVGTVQRGAASGRRKRASCPVADPKASKLS